MKKGVKTGSTQNPQQHEESSDSDEPLIEKLRKNAPKSNVKVVKGAVALPAPQTTPASQINNKTNTRRLVLYFLFANFYFRLIRNI